jgi:hypothetical protein
VDDGLAVGGGGVWLTRTRNPLLVTLNSASVVFKKSLTISLSPSNVMYLGEVSSGTCLLKTELLLKVVLIGISSAE